MLVNGPMLEHFRWDRIEECAFFFLNKHFHTYICHYKACINIYTCKWIVFVGFFLSFNISRMTWKTLNSFVDNCIGSAVCSRLHVTNAGSEAGFPR